MTDKLDFDLDFPTEEYMGIEPREIEANQLQTLSTYPLELDILPQKVEEKDLNYLNLQDLEKKVLVTELSDCDMYLKNIHKGFRAAVSVNSLVKLVGAGIGVHRHRRAVLNELKQSKKAGTILELDENGEVKT